MKTVDFIIKYNKRFLPLAVMIPMIAILTMSTPVKAAPAVTLTPASGAIGTKVTINGMVFDSYKGDNIYIFFNDTEITGSPLIVNQSGTFTADFYIPDDVSPGRYWIEARSDTSPTSMLARSFFIVEQAEIIPDVADGPVGTVVTVTGRGFYSSRTVTFYYYNIVGEKLSTQMASPVGAFSFQFTVPFSTAGNHRITAENAEGNLAETEFEVIPALALNLSSAGPGELLTARGNGFGYKTEVDIYFGLSEVARVKTDEFGNFEVVFNVPDVKPGPYDVKALDESGNLDKATFITTAGAKLDKSNGSIGTRLTVSGSGFRAGGPVTIDYDKLRITTIITDNNGAFSISFNVPEGSGGPHAIVVSDGETTKQLSFTVESEPPPAPQLRLPANNSESRAEAYMDWQDVSDPSPPVTYTLQIAGDSNFSSIKLEKEGLTDSEYTLSKKEALAAVMKYAPYYWRVKARDGAGNESEWSDPQAFYVSAPPVPALLLPVTGGRAEMPLFFNWQSVADLSPPMTYSLQVATDLNFKSIVLQREGLTDSEYTLPEDEALPETKAEAPYYWRVKARDDAGNESDWSAPQAFYTAAPFAFPGWLLYTVIGIIVIAVGYIAFRVGRRTAYNQAG